MLFHSIGLLLKDRTTGKGKESTGKDQSKPTMVTITGQHSIRSEPKDNPALLLKLLTREYLTITIGYDVRQTETPKRKTIHEQASDRRAQVTQSRGNLFYLILNIYTNPISIQLMERKKKR